ncbi:MAG: serine/threonine protein kinase, partial [Myxococcales bacterium]|nr:serine/threonine protein kinase [Myxococcales bacterium]
VHEAGIVHRDVKPENVILTPTGVRLMDFGAARRVDQTRTMGEVLGTLGYLPPEQASGAPATSASDTYALGVVLFEMWTGRRPFEAPDVIGLVQRMMTEDPPRPEGLPDDVASLVQGMLARAPGDRPTLAAVLETTAKHAAPGPVPAPRVPRAATPATSSVLVLVWRYARHVLAGGRPDLRSFGLALLADQRGVDGVEDTAP